MSLKLYKDTCTIPQASLHQALVVGPIILYYTSLHTGSTSLYIKDMQLSSILTVPFVLTMYTIYKAI